MTTPRRLLPVLVATLVVALAAAVPAAAAGPRVSVPSEARIRDAGGRLVAVVKDGGRHRFEVVKAPRGRERATALAVAARPGVVAVTVDRTASVDAWPASGSPDDAYYAGYQGDLAQVAVPAAWAYTRGSGARVAVLDTGAVLGHPDLAGLDVVGTYNAIDGSSNVADGHGHGTHVLGTVAAQTNNGIGVAGIAPDAEILVVKVLADSGSGSFAGICNGIEWAIAHGATVITMSLGASTTGSMDAYRYATDDAYAAGVTLLAAAGNDGTSTPHYPSSFPHVISVGSVNAANARSTFSQYGPTLDLMAPGEATMSTHLAGTYRQLSGTSMATPHVAGVAALVQSLVPGISPDAVETALRQTATDLGDPGRDDLYGAGLVDAANAITLATGGTPTPKPTPTPRPTPTPSPLPARVTRLAASPTSISYDGNGYCPAAVKATTVTAVTAPASATVAAATSVTLTFMKTGATSATSVPMTRGATTSTGTTWTAVLTAGTGPLTGAGSFAFWVTASAGAAVTRYPAGVGSVPLTLVACPNVAPAIGAVTAGAATVATNPLGTGTIPAGVPASTSVSAPATDTDGVAAAVLTVSGAGLATAASLPMALTAGGWSALVDPSALRVPGGALATKVTVTDRLGKAAVKTGPTLTVVRADTAGSAAVTGIANGADNRPVVAITADDRDAAFATTSSLSVTVRWTATYTDAAGATVTTPSATATAAYRGGRSFTAALPTTWLTTATSDVVITATPVAADPFGGRTTGTAVAAPVVANGAPTVIASAASAASVAVNPLGTGDTGALGLPASVTFTARVRDTDAIAGVVVAWSGPGVSGTRTLPMTLADGTWSATLDPTAAGVSGSGSLAWRVVATDARALAGAGAPGTVKVVRADTAGSIAAVRATTDAYNVAWVSLVGDDPDAAFAATTSTLKVAFSWTATWSTATGATVTKTGTTTTTTYGGNRSWYGKVASSAWLPGARSVTLVVVPTATDPYGRVTRGAAFTTTLKAYGIP